MITYRRGRTRYVGENWCMAWCPYFLVGLVSVGIVWYSISTETSVGITLKAIDEIKSQIVPLDINQLSDEPSVIADLKLGGKLVHISSSVVNASISDPDFNLHFNGAFKMFRNTEYCQWQELSHETCHTCYREVMQSNGKSKRESYSCNCIRKYSYIKHWRNSLINSFFFDQPGAHHNPDRDPYPSRIIVAENVRIGARNPVFLDNTVVRHIKGTRKPLRWSRQDPILSDFLVSYAHRHDRFVYAGNGYFFSPNVESNVAFLLKKFTQWMEGSILDYQFGDLIPSCTAGDIRVKFDVIETKSVSVIGNLSVDPQWNRFVLHEYLTPTHVSIAMVQEGLYSVEEMLGKEVNDLQWERFWARLLGGGWTLVVVTLWYWVHRESTTQPATTASFDKSKWD